MTMRMIIKNKLSDIRFTYVQGYQVIRSMRVLLSLWLKIYVCKIWLEFASSLIHRLLILSSCRAKLGGYFMTFLVCIPLHLCQSTKGHFVTPI